MSTTVNLPIPTVHLNGTSREDLLTQICEASTALLTAIEKVSEAAPHGRDYYPQGDDAFRRARDMHRARIAALRNVRRELEEIGESIVAPDTGLEA